MAIFEIYLKCTEVEYFEWCIAHDVTEIGDNGPGDASLMCIKIGWDMKNLKR